MKLLMSAAMAAVLVAGFPLIASAQDSGSNFSRAKNVSVRERPRPDYEAVGAKLGGFTVYPRLTVEAEHNDNVYATSTGEKSDTIWRVRPEVAVRSDWSRHALGAFAAATINRYADFDSENTEDYTAGINGRLDVSRGSSISGTLQYQALTEPRTAPTAPAAVRAPVEYTLSQASLVGVKEFNRLRLSGRLENKVFNYKDARAVGGGVVDQDVRDRDELVYGGKAEYAVSPDTALFAAVVGNTKNYDLAAAGRDSKGYNATIGANFELSQLVRGDVEFGYMAQSYDNPAYGDVTGASAKGRVEWFPSELTTVTATGARTIEESVATGSQGFISDTIALGVDHELLRNVLLAARASYGKDAYESIARDDKRTGANASVVYLLNRRVGLFLDYSYLKQDSSGSARGASFVDNKLAASVALQF